MEATIFHSNDKTSVRKQKSTQGINNNSPIISLNTKPKGKPTNQSNWSMSTFVTKYKYYTEKKRKPEILKY